MCFSAIVVCATCQGYDMLILNMKMKFLLLSVYYSNLLKYVHLIIQCYDWMVEDYECCGIAFTFMFTLVLFVALFDISTIKYTPHPPETMLVISYILLIKD